MAVAAILDAAIPRATTATLASRAVVTTVRADGEASHLWALASPVAGHLGWYGRPWLPPSPPPPRAHRPQRSPKGGRWWLTVSCFAAAIAHQPRSAHLTCVTPPHAPHPMCIVPAVRPLFPPPTPLSLPRPPQFPTFPPSRQPPSPMPPHPQSTGPGSVPTPRRRPANGFRPYQSPRDNHADFRSA